MKKFNFFFEKKGNRRKKAKYISERRKIKENLF